MKSFRWTNLINHLQQQKRKNTQQTNNFLWLFLGSNQYRAGRVYGLCVYFMTGAPKGSSKVVLQKPGIEPATPGLQGIARIHCTSPSL